MTLTAWARSAYILLFSYASLRGVNRAKHPRRSECCNALRLAKRHCVIHIADRNLEFALCLRILFWGRTETANRANCLSQLVKSKIYAAFCALILSWLRDEACFYELKCLLKRWRKIWCFQPTERCTKKASPSRVKSAFNNPVFEHLSINMGDLTWQRRRKLLSVFNIEISWKMLSQLARYWSHHMRRRIQAPYQARIMHHLWWKLSLSKVHVNDARNSRKYFFTVTIWSA